jgi:hypothetical protein
MQLVVDRGDPLGKEEGEGKGDEERRRRDGEGFPLIVLSS